MPQPPPPRGDAHLSLLDVRSDMETSEGRIRGGNRDAVELPLFQARSTWDATLGRRVVQVTPSPQPGGGGRG